MNKEEAIERMMDYLFGEMDPQEKKEFEEILSQDADLHKEVEELKQTRSMLSLIPEPESSFGDTEQQKYSSGPLNRSDSLNSEQTKQGVISNGMKVVFSAAASILVIMLCAAWAGVEIQSTNEGFTMRFGASEPAQEMMTEEQQPEERAVTEEELMRFAEEIKTENSLLVASLLSELQENQRHQIEEAVQILGAYYEQKRQDDLDLIADGFNQIQVETAYRFLQTDETIGNIIYALHNQ